MKFQWPGKKHLQLQYKNAVWTPRTFKEPFPCTSETVFLPHFHGT